MRKSITRLGLPQPFYFSLLIRDSANAVPTNKNCALDSPAFGVIAGVNPIEVQWKGLALGVLPTWSQYPPCQVSMISKVDRVSLY